jgi:hypothetical protein
MNQACISKKTIIFILSVILISATFLRLWQIDRPSLWEDDYLNLDRGLLPLKTLWETQKLQGMVDTPYDFQPPLSFAFLHVLTDISKTSTSAKMLSVVAGVMAIWGMFELGRTLFGVGPGLLAAFLLSISIFHLEYSRAIKAYSLFFCFSLWSTVFVHRAVVRGRFWDWCGWALTATGMLYSAYIGLPAFVGQAGWAGLMAGMGMFAKKDGIGRQPAAFVVTAGMVALAYMPWLPAVLFLQKMFNDPGVDPFAKLTWKFAGEVLAGFYVSWHIAPFWLVPTILALSLAGTVWALWRRMGNVLLLLLWAGLPTASVLLSKSVMSGVVSSRHVFNLLGLVTLLPAVGIWGLARMLTKREHSALILGFVVCLGLVAPQTTMLDDFYRHSISQDRDYLYWLWATARPGDGLNFQGWKYKSKAFGSRWYLSGFNSPPGDSSQPGFRRLLIVRNQLGSDSEFPRIPESTLLSDDNAGFYSIRTERLCVLSRSPLYIFPDKDETYFYEDDFSTTNMLTDTYASSNLFPNFELHHLEPVRASLPGWAIYHFVVPNGVRLTNARLQLNADLFKRNTDHFSDASVEVQAGPDMNSMSRVGTIGQADFLDQDGKQRVSSCKGYEEQAMYGSCSHADIHMDLGGADKGDLWIAIRFHPGISEGYLVLNRLRVEAICEGGSSTSPNAMKLRNLLANGHVHPWHPDDVSLDGLFAFAACPEQSWSDLPISSPKDLRLFQTEHPGLSPAYTMKDDSGQAVAYFYDPPVQLSSEKPKAQVVDSKKTEVRGLILSGKMEVPSLQIGEGEVNIPVVAPRGSRLMINPGGQGRLVWSPDFSQAVFGDLDFIESDNLRPTPDADNDGGMTCREERPCSFQARFVSALPVNRVRLEWYPQVEGRPVVGTERLSYSTDDGKTFVLLEELTGQPSVIRSGVFIKHAKTLDFSDSIHYFRIKVELSGEPAQMWSHRRVLDRMWLEASMDARSIRPFTLPEGDFRLALTKPAGNTVNISFLDKPVPFFDALKDWR